MGRHFKTFSDGSIAEYDRGAFDNWCVYLQRPNKSRFAPRDIWYFSALQNLARAHGGSRIYNDFVKFYEVTKSEINLKVLEGITRLSAAYEDDALLIDILFSVIYAGMIAEERKASTRLGKRVKRLGMHQLLMEGMDAHKAASFSRGMPWRAIAAQCERRGF